MGDQAMRASMADRTQLKQALDATMMRVREADDRLSTTVGEKSLVHAHFEQVNVEKERLQAQAQQVSNENKALRSRIVGLEQAAQGYQDQAAALQERFQIVRAEKEDMEDRLRQFSQPAPRATQQALAMQGAL